MLLIESEADRISGMDVAYQPFKILRKNQYWSFGAGLFGRMPWA